VIHNGIENFQNCGCVWRRTDTSSHLTPNTECIAHLIEEHLRDGSGLADAVRASVRELQGAYAMVVLSGRRTRSDRRCERSPRR